MPFIAESVALVAAAVARHDALLLQVRRTRLQVKQRFGQLRAELEQGKRRAGIAMRRKRVSE